MRILKIIALTLLAILAAATGLVAVVVLALGVGVWLAGRSLRRRLAGGSAAMTPATPRPPAGSPAADVIDVTATEVSANAEEPRRLGN